MRLIKCRDCGKEFDASEYQYLCPECRAKVRKSVPYRQRVCIDCGATFMGFPRSKRCPSCQQAAVRASGRQHLKRKKRGETRLLGSTDICQRCGKEYIVVSGIQRYCPECSKDAIRENCRKHNREYNAGVGAARVKLAKSDAHNRKICVVCGNPIPPGMPTVTCSPECAEARIKFRWKVADIKRDGKKIGENIYQRGKTYYVIGKYRIIETDDETRANDFAAGGILSDSVNSLRAALAAEKNQVTKEHLQILIDAFCGIPFEKIAADHKCSTDNIYRLKRTYADGGIDAILDPPRLHRRWGYTADEEKAFFDSLEKRRSAGEHLTQKIIKSEYDAFTGRDTSLATVYAAMRRNEFSYLRQNKKKDNS